MAEEPQVPQTPVAPAAPEPRRELTVEQAAQSLASIFDDNGVGQDLPDTRADQERQEAEHPGQKRGQDGKWVAADKPEAAETETVEESAPAAPEDWDEAQREAFAKLAPEAQAILTAADAARRKAVEAKQTEFAEKLKAAEDYPNKIKALEENYGRIAQITEAQAELTVTLKREFGDIKSREDHLALSDPNSPKYDPARAQRFETLLGMGRQITEAKALAEHNRAETLKAETAKAMREEEAKLYKAIPEWGDLAKKDMPKLRAELAEVRSHLKTLGVDAETADGLYNATHLQIARESMLYRKAQAEKAQADKVAKEKIAAAPRVQKPGASRQQNGASEALEATRNRLRQSGRLEDAAELLRLQGI